jgi:hypothetical protein
MLDPDPALRPSSRAVHGALRELLRDPGRPVDLGRPRIAPVRPFGAWLVVGVDPVTGSPSIVRADLSWHRANDLAEHLVSQGWRVEVAREGLGTGDLAWIALATLVGAVVVPIVGAPLFAYGSAWVLSQRCRPELRTGLPSARAPLPPRVAAELAEYHAAIGILLLIAAALLAFWTIAAVIPLVPAAFLAVVVLRHRHTDAEVLAARARVEVALLEARAALDRDRRPLDESLALLGELESIEHDRRRGDDPEALLARADSLATRIRHAAGTAEPPARGAIEALRRGDDPGAS